MSPCNAFQSATRINVEFPTRTIPSPPLDKFRNVVNYSRRHLIIKMTSGHAKQGTTSQSSICEKRVAMGRIKMGVIGPQIVIRWVIWTVCATAIKRVIKWVR
ncbi:hypothetical protein AX17_004041 [Amanita inopinata Kibby_2008]|nr:hypothetical protein AX17_004041 [Amanita inopinata Kibby_2008]